MPIRIEDYLITIAVIASVIALARANTAIAMKDSNGSSFQIDPPTFFWLYYSPIFLVLNLFAIPGVLIAFRQNPFFARLGFGFLYSLCLWFILFVLSVVMTLLNGSGSITGTEIFEVLSYAFCFIAVVSLFVNVAIQFSRLSGYQLRGKRDDLSQSRLAESLSVNHAEALSPQFSRHTEVRIDPFSDETESLAASRATRKPENLDPSQRLARWLTLGLIGYAILANLMAMA